MVVQDQRVWRAECRLLSRVPVAFVSLPACQDQAGIVMIIAYDSIFILGSPSIRVVAERRFKAASPSHLQTTVI